MPVTPDEVYATMASKAPVRSAADWQDFFEMPPSLQEAEAQLIKTAIFERQDGPTVWADLLGALGVAATVAGDLTGIGSALLFFKALA